MPEITGRLITPRLAGAPATPVMGELYFDTSLNTLFYWNGTKWIWSGDQFQETIASGLWGSLWPYTSLGTQNLGVGLLRATRTTLLQAISQVQFEVTTANAAASVRVLVYADTPTGPGALIAQSDPIDCSTTGAKLVALALNPGSYWFAVHNLGTASTAMRSVLGMNPFLIGTDQPGNNATHNCWQVPNQGTTVKDPFPMATVQRQGAFASLFFQAT